MPPRVDTFQERIMDQLVEDVTWFVGEYPDPIKGPVLLKDNVLEVSVQDKHGRFDVYQISVVKKRCGA